MGINTYVQPASTNLHYNIEKIPTGRSTSEPLVTTHLLVPNPHLCTINTIVSVIVS